MNYEIINYSEKSIALIGDTKSIKDELKKIGGRFNPRLSCGAGWIFSKSKQNAVESLINGGLSATPIAAPTSKPKGISPELKAEIKAYHSRVWNNDPHMVDYCTNKIAHAVKLSNGLIMVIEKPSIQTSFCFGESGFDYDDAKNMAYKVARTEEYFKNENMAEFDNTIAELKKCKILNEWGHKDVYAYMRVQSYYGCDDRVICEVFASDHSPEYMRGQRDGYEMLPDEDIDTAIALYEEARAAFKKRVDAYWKRYGDSKLKTWTYWRDR